jgi:hypothetical protein
MESIPHYGENSNNISNSKPEEELGSPLNGINQIGFFSIHALGNHKQEQANLVLWMKRRLEQIGRVVILDQANGINFTGLAKGGWASIGNYAVTVQDFKKKNTTYLRELQRLNLKVSASIRIEETKKLASLETIWSQEMFVDASDIDNVMIGYKDLIENLIDDLNASNIHYKQPLVFYLYVDTTYNPEIKKILGPFISPPPKTFSDSEGKVREKT